MREAEREVGRREQGAGDRERRGEREGSGGRGEHAAAAATHPLALRLLRLTRLVSSSIVRALMRLALDPVPAGLEG